MADTYSNTTNKSHGMTEPSNKHKLKYAQDFNKSSNALDNTSYMKKQKACENMDNRIVKKQKKHY